MCGLRHAARGAFVTLLLSSSSSPTCPANLSYLSPSPLAVAFTRHIQSTKMKTRKIVNPSLSLSLSMRVCVRVRACVRTYSFICILIGAQSDKMADNQSNKQTNKQQTQAAAEAAGYKRHYPKSTAHAHTTRTHAHTCRHTHAQPDLAAGTHTHTHTQALGALHVYLKMRCLAADEFSEAHHPLLPPFPLSLL